MTTSKEIPTELKEAREYEGISQTELGRRVRIPQSHISKIESGAVDIQLSSLVQIARGLGYEIRLVPKSLVPAVDSQIKSTRETLKDRTRQALNAIVKAVNNLDVLPVAGLGDEIENLKYNLRRLRELNYNQTDLDLLKKKLSPLFNPAGLLKPEDSGPKSRKTLLDINNQLEALRNNLTHKVEYESGRDIPVYSVVDVD